MSGVNPYIQQPDFVLPQEPYKITFLPADVTVEVQPAMLPHPQDGLPGSLLASALEAGLDMDHSCGGSVPVRPATSGCVPEWTVAMKPPKMRKTCWTWPWTTAKLPTGLSMCA